KFVFEEPKTPLGQSLIPGVAELRLTIRFLLHVRGGERKRSLVVVLAGSEQAAVRERRKSYVFLCLSQKSPKLQPSILRVGEIRLVIRFLL
ncbi:hypothetical protein LINPERPRIM_LOCUS23138, partial [Linum perenne]